VEVASFAFTVNVAVVAAVGVPEMTPVDEASESPAGSEPLTSEYVTVPCVEVAAIVCEYAMPTVPEASDAVVILTKENCRTRLFVSLMNNVPLLGS
jgi:hypothetical protein